MVAYLVQRLLSVTPVLVLITLCVFLLTMLTGDPAAVLMGEESLRNPGLHQKLVREMGLDRPILIQYADWLGKVLRGDLGRSVRDFQPVMDNLLNRLPVTVELSILAMACAMAIAFPVGITSAVRPGSKLDVAGSCLAMWGVAMPHFWLGLLMVLVFSVKLHWLPATGYGPIAENPVTNLRSMILPVFVLGTGLAASIMRQVRSAMLEVLRQDYILSARARGLSERRVVWIHALKNALIPVITIMGLQIGQLFGGAVVTETIFGLPGTGRMMFEALSTRDFPMVQGIMLFMGIMVVTMNLVTDLAYSWLDPRIRYS